MIKKIISCILFFCVSIISSQNQFVDSLKTLLTKAKEDTSKVFLYTDIADELADADFKKSLEYANNGIALALKLNFKKGEAQAYAVIANAYSNQNNYVKCLEYNNKALDIRRELNNQREISASLCNIGNVYNDQGNFTKALEYYNQCLIIDEKSGNKKMLSQLYNNIGNAYANKGDLKQSITYIFKSYKLKVELGNKKGAANCCNNLAVIYKMQGNFNQSLNYNKQALGYRLQLADSQGIAFSYANIALTYHNLKQDDTAEIFFLKGLSLFNRLGYTKGIASVQNGLGIIYKTKKQYDKAILAYSSALKISEAQNDKIGIAVAMSNLASVYGKKKNVAEAKKYFEQSEHIAKETQSLEVLMNMYDLYSVFYEDNTDFKNALKYHLLYTDARDSLRSKDNNDALAEVKTRYETDIKEKENDILKNENELKTAQLSKSKLIQVFLAIGVILVIIVSYLLFVRIKLKQKQTLDKELLAQQELRSKAIIEAEEKERVRIARELHDGIGQQLSAAKLNISGLQAALKTTKTEEITMLQNAIDLLDESVKEVRVVSHSMMPNALIKSGLVSAVREFINKISSSGNLKINLEIVGLNERLEVTVENIIFRILQEVVNNIIKHSKATEVGIQFIKHDKELTILIEDNGVGFNVEKELNTTDGGIGLKNIQSRIAFLNGEVNFDSFPQKGTTVSIDIPL